MHKRVGLVIFFVHYYIFLRERGDRRVKTVKLLLLTATREGPMVEPMERLRGPPTKIIIMIDFARRFGVRVPLHAHHCSQFKSRLLLAV